MRLILPVNDLAELDCFAALAMARSSRPQSFRPIAKNFAARASRSSSRDMLPREASASSIALPAASTAAAWVAVRAAERFGNDAVDDAELQEIGGGDLHARRRVLRARGIAPEDRGGGLGRSDGVDRVLQHQNLARSGDRQRAARAAFADDHRNAGRAKRQARRRSPARSPPPVRAPRRRCRAKRRRCRRGEITGRSKRSASSISRAALR